MTMIWLWGGTLADIQHTITVGVRSTSPDTRQSQMPAFGRDGILKPAQINDLTEYVVHLSGRAADAAAVDARQAAVRNQLRGLSWAGRQGQPRCSARPI